MFQAYGAEMFIKDSYAISL